jgi:predicted DNA-binding transcriptional regulator YafY
MPRTKKQGKKLGIDQVREIRKALARVRNPVSAPSLARQYGVSNRTIYDIRDGKTWA